MFYRFREILEHTYTDPQPINDPVWSQEEADTRIVLYCVYNATRQEWTSSVLFSLPLLHTQRKKNKHLMFKL